MARQPVKVRGGTRSWLDSALKEKGFDAINEFLRLYREAIAEGKLELQNDMVKVAWDRLYPKARPEDHDGDPGDTNVIAPVIVGPEQMKELVQVARGIKK